MSSPLSRPTLAAALALALGLGACGDDPPRPAPVEPARASVEPKVKPPAPVVAPRSPDAAAPNAAPAPAPVAADAGAAAPITRAERPPLPVEVPAPTSIDDAMKEAAAKAKAGDRDGAIAVLHAGVSRWPRNATARVELARLYLAAGEPGRARPHAEEATRLRTDWSTAWNTLGRAELGMARLDDAASSFQRAIEANETNRHAWNNLGHTLILQKKWSDAVDALEQAVDGDPVEPYMWNNLGMALENLDRLDEARAAYEQGAAAGSHLAARNRERLEGLDSLAVVPLPGASGGTD